MLRFLLTMALLIVALPLWAQSEGKLIEIYAAGKHYASLEAYKNRHLLLQAAENTPQEEQDMQETAKSLGLDIDPKKIKTIEVKAPISAKTKEKLELVGADRGLDGVVADFRQNWNNPNPQERVASQQLEDKIREAVGEQQDPVLLISDNGKMRIMALTPQELPPAQ